MPGAQPTRTVQSRRHLHSHGEDRLREMFTGKDYAIDLFPISQYYSPDHYRAYEAANVRKCILYIVRARKDAASGLVLTDHPYGAITGASLDVKVQLQRQIARRRFQKRQGENRP